MTDAAALLDEVYRRGATARRIGDHIHLQPATALPTDLIDRLRTHKADLLRLLPDAEPTGPWRVVIESCEPRREQFALNPWTKVTDPARCIECTLIDLQLAVAHRNAGYDTAFTELVDEYVVTLAACGCKVHLECVS